jgi:hypothetical protein
MEAPVSYESYDIPEPIRVADVNGDARQDIVVAHGGWVALGVYLQQADGALMPEQALPDTLCIALQLPRARCGGYQRRRAQRCGNRGL